MTVEDAARGYGAMIQGNVHHGTCLLLGLVPEAGLEPARYR
jgi:hypothetical protein